MSKTTRLIIARHGNTFEADETPRRVGLITDLPLTETGQEQGIAIGRYLKDNNLLPDAVFSSYLRRTIDTAKMAMAGANINLPVQPESMFNEIDYGPDENKTEDEVIARLGAQALQDWDEKAVIPDGWNIDPDEITQNWFAFGKRIAQNYEGCTIAAFTSNGIARFAPHLTGDFEGFRANHKIKIATGALCILEHTDDKWIIKDWNVRP